MESSWTLLWIFSPTLHSQCVSSCTRCSADDDTHNNLLPGCKNTDRPQLSLSLWMPNKPGFACSSTVARLTPPLHTHRFGSSTSGSFSEPPLRFCMCPYGSGVMSDTCWLGVKVPVCCGCTLLPDCWWSKSYRILCCQDMLLFKSNSFTLLTLCGSDRFIWVFEH